ncbi:hypothetical protein HHK36_015003 [Tetracentron sinense]|uniref:Uncharacterized protein n=1 Tax=Tetracentron sinense TaxID=13715 RepID=A0A835DCE1_TETSI|nr:hypothetical protein HHK36_015003 [Tetracentron sinense]
MLPTLCKSITSKRLLFKKCWIVYLIVAVLHSKNTVKQKIYLAWQDQFDIPNSEELDRMKKEAKLQQDMEDQKRAINEELEIEYNEDAGVNLQSSSNLMPRITKRGRGH